MMYGYGIGFSPSNRLFSGVLANPYSLDAFGTPAVWYELVKRFDSYTGACIRVRRSSDNAEQDIPFLNNLLDTASLLSFVGAGNGFVTTFYTQVGADNLTQVTAGSQPQIVSAGALITRNGFTSVKYNGTSTDLRNFTSAIINTENVSYFSVAQCDVAGGVGIISNQYSVSVRTIRNNIDRGVNVYSLSINNTLNVGYYVYGASQIDNANLRLISSYISSSKLMSTFQNGVAGTTLTYVGTTNNDGLQLGRQQSGGLLNGSINCFGAYNTDNSANRVAIETIINNYYSIY